MGCRASLGVKKTFHLQTVVADTYLKDTLLRRFLPRTSKCGVRASSEVCSSRKALKLVVDAPSIFRQLF